MKHLAVSILAMLFAVHSFAQLPDKAEILEEGTRLYKTEMASWYGTDLFVANFKEKHADAGGYLSYVEGDRAICLFFSSASKPKVLASFSFDNTYDIKTATTDGQEREFSQKEYDLYVIRQITLSEINIDTLYKSYEGMNANLIPLNDEKGKRVYILTGTQKQGVVVFGNDCLYTFDQNNKLIGKKRLHKNIIPIEAGGEGDKEILSTVHSHLPETGDLITATDVCTLKLYGRFTTWKHHFVISNDYVSTWDCKNEKLQILTKKAWDTIMQIADESNKKKN